MATRTKNRRRARRFTALWYAAAAGGIAVGASGAFFGWFGWSNATYTPEAFLPQGSLSQQGTTTERADGTHAPGNANSLEDPTSPLYLPTPEPVRAIYMSQCVVGSPELRDKLVRLVAATELNAIVIDVKDYTGTIGFPTEHPLLKEAALRRCGARDMRLFLRSLKEKRIYTIARITVFQDPWYAERHPDQAVQRKSKPGTIWRDRKGLAFVDVSARPFWEYILTLARQARAVGFDEINFDYIRFPSDGPMDDIALPWTKETPKPEALERFFAFLDRELRKKDGVPISADLFGMTTTALNDLNIGQVLERAAPYFDYLAPMVYPSHYPPGFIGLSNPNSDPYRVVFHSLSQAIERLEATSSPFQTLQHEPRLMRTRVVPASSSSPTTTQQVWMGRYRKPSYPRSMLRPWLQDFDYGGTYGPKEVRAQIQAVYDAGLSSWMLWSPSNRYTREALRVEPSEPSQPR